MIMDKQLIFSENQTTGSAATNTLDIGPFKAGVSDLRLFVMGAPGVTGGGTVTAKLQTGAKLNGAGNSIESPVSILECTIPADALAKGGILVNVCLPANAGRYLSLLYTFNGTVTGAKLTAGLALDTETH